MPIMNGPIKVYLNGLSKYGEAITCFDKALAIDPNSALAWNNKGFSFDRLGRHNEAKECYDKAQQQPTQNNGKSIKEDLNSIKHDKRRIKRYTSDGKPVYE